MATMGPHLVQDVLEMRGNGSNFTTCALFDGQQHLCDAILGVKRFLSVFAMLGCLAVILAICLFRKYLIFIQRLILYLSVAAFFKSIFSIMGDDYKPGPLCTFQAWSLSLFSWAVLIWNCIVTFNLYMTAIKSIKTDKVEWVYHVISWGVSFIIACLPLIGNHYGPAGMWCWITNNWGWRFGSFYLPLVISLVAMLIAYIYIAIVVNRQTRTWEGLYDPDVERKKQLLREDLKPLRWYPFAYLATSVFPLINRIQNAVHDKPVFALTMMQAISNPLYGFVLAVIFFADKEIRSQITPSKIKDAFNFHRNQEANIIREYPATDDGYQTRDDGTLAPNPCGDSVQA